MYYYPCLYCKQTIYRNSTKCATCEEEYHGRCTVLVNDKRFCIPCSKEEIESISHKPKKHKKEIVTLKNYEKFLPEKDFSFRYKIDKSFFSEEFKKGKLFFLGENELKIKFPVHLNENGFNVFICKMCFTQKNDKISFLRHCEKCLDKSTNEFGIKLPKRPGILIYKDTTERIKVYKLDGKNEKINCRNICGIGKSYIQEKTLYYDVELFEFYVLYKEDDFAGYFSRQKNTLFTNLSCIVILPHHQKKGLGFFLIDLSYKIQERIGSPERPLSKDGLLAYQTYWKVNVYLELLRNNTSSINQISLNTGIKLDDVIYALELLGVLKNKNINEIILPDFKLKEYLFCKENCFIE